MKHLKLYEKKFNKNSLKEFTKEKDELYELIKEYTILNNIFEFDDDDTIIDVYYENNYNVVGDEVIIVTVIDSQEEVKPYSIINLTGLNFFIANPDKYRTATKFNL